MPEYNGWTNYETWAVALWLDNEQGSQAQALDLARECYAEAEPTTYWTRQDAAKYKLADSLKTMHEEGADTIPELNGTVFADLLSAALSEVNWSEIAGHYIDDLNDEICKHCENLNDDGLDGYCGACTDLITDHDDGEHDAEADTDCPKCEETTDADPNP